MTVFEAYSKLWTYFKEHDTFIMDDNFHDIVTITDEPARDKACIQSALDDWTKSEMLTVQKDFSWKEDSPKKDIYILKKSLDSNEQSVSIHPNLAGFMMNEINGFCGLIEDKTDWCDPTDLSSKDVMNLLHILNFYKTKYKEAIGEAEEDSKDSI
tara:strand:+ start:1967 stop:2431 length:465 start_codon:yes stop_codon:yes gene_type:complete